MASGRYIFRLAQDALRLMPARDVRALSLCAKRVTVAPLDRFTTRSLSQSRTGFSHKDSRRRSKAAI